LGSTYTRAGNDLIYQPIGRYADGIGLVTMRHYTKEQLEAICSCGQRKRKFKNCCAPNEKDRIIYETLWCEFNVPVDSTALEFRQDPRTEEVRIFERTTRIQIYPNRAYLLGDFKHQNDLKQKNTPTYKIPLLPSSLQGNELNALKQFDGLCVMDTNQFLPNPKISAGIPFLLDVQDIRTSSKEIKLFPLPGMGVTHEEKPENIGWALAIDQILKLPNYTEKMRIGIVVDADLDNLDEYNKRTKPYVGTSFLPQGFELIFATDEGGKSLLRKCIEKCHKEGKRLMEIFRHEEEVIKKEHYPSMTSLTQ
jgi:hypothetical protein